LCLDRVRPNDVALLLVPRANVRLQRGGRVWLSSWTLTSGSANSHP
jgi:hypothetical protein